MTGTRKHAANYTANANKVYNAISTGTAAPAAGQAEQQVQQPAAQEAEAPVQPSSPQPAATAAAEAAPQPEQVQKAEGSRKTYTEEERQAFMASLRTGGRKGCKLPRINMAFTPELYDYIRTMSKVSGLTLTVFLNTVLKQYMDEHREQYDRALEFRNSL